MPSRSDSIHSHACDINQHSPVWEPRGHKRTQSRNVQPLHLSPLVPSSLSLSSSSSSSAPLGTNRTELSTAPRRRRRCPSGWRPRSIAASTPSARGAACRSSPAPSVRGAYLLAGPRRRKRSQRYGRHAVLTAAHRHAAPREDRGVRRDGWWRQHQRPGLQAELQQPV